MIIMHIVNEMKTVVYKSHQRRHEIFKSAIICLNDETIKLSFSKVIDDYNLHMKKSNDNVQQQSYYSSHRIDNRY